jgi:hypothetical protein
LLRAESTVLLATTRKLRSFPLCGNSKIFIPYAICFCFPFPSTWFSYKMPGLVTDYNFLYFGTIGRIILVISQILIVSSNTLDPSVTFYNLCYILGSILVLSKKDCLISFPLGVSSFVFSIILIFNRVHFGWIFSWIQVCFWNIFNIKLGWLGRKLKTMTS